MISDDQIDRWRALADAATPGPWRWRISCLEQLSDAGQGYSLDFYPDCETVQESQCPECGTRIGPSDHNGAFIAAAREAVPALIAEVTRLRELVASPLRPLTETEIITALHEGHAVPSVNR